MTLLSILLDGEEAEYGPDIWSMFHCAFINEDLWKRLIQSIGKLNAIKTWQDFRASKYGRLIRFCDAATFHAVREHIESMMAAPESCLDDAKHYWENLRGAATKYEGEDAQGFQDALTRAGLRSAGPLGIQTEDEIMSAFKANWSVEAIDSAKASGLMPNPLFKPLARPGASLDIPPPVLGFHLAAALAPLTDQSPLRHANSSAEPNSQNLKLGKAMQTAALQFSTWAQAFFKMSDNVVIRFAAAEPFAFCQTLQAYCSTGALTADLYRKQYTYQSIVLDSVEYGSQETPPKRFDTIEAGGLVSDTSCLNLLMSAHPLLKDSASATLFTDMNVEREEGQSDVFERMFLGSAAEISLLLGVTPVEYVTDATVTSSVDELFAKQSERSKIINPKQRVSLRLSWKRTHQLARVQLGAGRLSAEAEDISAVLFKIYKRMLGHWAVSQPKTGGSRYLAEDTATFHYHMGSFAYLIKFAQCQIKAEWDDVSDRLKTMMRSYQNTDHVLDFSLEFATLSKVWRVYQPQIPDVVVVNIQISRDLFMVICEESSMLSTFTIVVTSHHDEGPPKQDAFASLFSGFGSIEISPHDNSLLISEGDRVRPVVANGYDQADVIISFYTPSHILCSEPKPTSFKIQISNKGTQESIRHSVGHLGDKNKVLVTRSLPGLSEGHQLTIPSKVDRAIAISHNEQGDDTGQEEYHEFNDTFNLDPLFPNFINPSTLPYSIKYSLKVDQQREKVVNMIAHIDIKGQKGKDLLLVDRCAVTLSQESPFLVRVCFADSNYAPVCVFPIPVMLDKTSKPRVARQSSWVEFIVSVADFVTAAPLIDYVFPNQISVSGEIFSQNLPYINIDVLPILDISDQARTGFLTTLASMQFSAKERVLREEAQATTDAGIMPSARANFKETVMTMFMLASGVQGGQSGLMALNVEGGQGIHMLFLVSAIRLDGPTSSAILDAAVIPVTSTMLLDPTFGDFLMALRHFEIATLIVNEDELRLWKKALPAMVERCRAWAHSDDCEYRKVRQAPVSMDHGQLVLCGCGKGKLPGGFVSASLPGWDEVGVHHATRVAISPTFAVPLVEDLVSAENLVKMQSSRPSARHEQCVNCGATAAVGGGRLKKCTRCHKVQYCSPRCQKKDWSKHRPECGKVSEVG